MGGRAGEEGREAFSLLCVPGRSWQQMNFLSCVTENVLHFLGWHWQYPFFTSHHITELGKLPVSFILVPLHALGSSCSIYDEASDFYYCIYLKYWPVKSLDVMEKITGRKFLLFRL